MSSTVFETFSASDWTGYLPNEEFFVLKSNRYGQLQRRKVSKFFPPRSS